MFKRTLVIFIFLFILQSNFAQVVNRAPFIQRPSQTSVTIAWRRANTSTGKLYLGTAPGVWIDTLYSPAPTKKHYFDIAGLMPNTEYFYQAYSAAPGDTFTSLTTSFFTAKQDTADDIRFLVYGDCGYNNVPQHQVKDLMENEDAEFALVTGDVDQNVGDNYDGVFFNVYQNILDNDCHFTCIGNHDTYADGAATYLDAFYLFHNNPENSERYYSFTWADAKFICLDANISYAVGSAQYDWMIDELKCNDKKWLFVYCHQPPWSNAWSADYYIPFSPYFLYQGNEDMRTILVPKWEQYGVDFVVNGHSHCYQRGSYNGINYLISGGGGASTLDFNTNSNSPNISVEIYENHYVKFLISGNTAKYYMIDKYGVYRDSVIVTKSYEHYDPQILTTAETCSNSNDGMASIAPAGPNAPYTWIWENNTSVPTLINLTPGTHSVTVTDANGCIREETFEIEEHPSINNSIYSAGVGFSFCENDSLQLYAVPGYASYSWNNGSNTAATYATNTGAYSILITDSSGCTQIGNQLVNEILLPNSNFTYTDNNNLVVDFNAPLNDPSTIYSWNFGDGFTDAGSANTSHFYLMGGSYDVQLITSNSCGTDTAMITINIDYAAGLDSYLQSIKVSVAPNPFNEQTTFSFSNPNNEKFNLQIFNIKGQLVSNNLITTEQFIIGKAKLSAGVYIYILRSNTSRTTGRIIVE